MKSEKKLIALNYPAKNGSSIINQVIDVNIFTDECGKLDLEDTAYLSSGAYKKIFDSKRSEVRKGRKILSVIKIRNPKSGLSIYRKYQYNPDFKGINDNMIALHPASIRELVNEDNSAIVGETIEVSKGNCFCFFWHHPFHATRISMKLGFISIVLAIISIIVAIITSCHCCCC